MMYERGVCYFGCTLELDKERSKKALFGLRAVAAQGALSISMTRGLLAVQAEMEVSWPASGEAIMEYRRGHGVLLGSTVERKRRRMEKAIDGGARLCVLDHEIRVHW